MFFAGIYVIKTRGIEEFLRGAITNTAQRIYLQVHDSLRNFLFTNVPGQEGMDLISLSIERGRDHALPSFNGIRVKFHLPKAKRFSNITKNGEVQRALESVYGDPSKVEAFIGLVAEDHARGSSMGNTLLEVWRREFHRLRDGDRFYYENDGVFSQELKDKIPRVRNLFTNKPAFREIVLRNTDIIETELPKMMFFTK